MRARPIVARDRNARFGRVRKVGGDLAPFALSWVGLTSDVAEIGTHGSIGYSSDITPDSVIWSNENPAGADKSGAAATYGTGANPTALDAGDGGSLFLHVGYDPGDGTVWRTLSVPIRQPAPTYVEGEEPSLSGTIQPGGQANMVMGTEIADGRTLDQSFIEFSNDGSTVAGIAVSGFGEELPLSYAIPRDYPEGRYLRARRDLENSGGFLSQVTAWQGPTAYTAPTVSGVIDNADLYDSETVASVAATFTGLGTGVPDLISAQVSGPVIKVNGTARAGSFALTEDDVVVAEWTVTHQAGTQVVTSPSKVVLAAPSIPALSSLAIGPQSGDVVPMSYEIEFGSNAKIVITPAGTIAALPVTGLAAEIAGETVTGALDYLDVTLTALDNDTELSNFATGIGPASVDAHVLIEGGGDGDVYFIGTFTLNTQEAPVYETVAGGVNITSVPSTPAAPTYTTVSGGVNIGA